MIREQPNARRSDIGWLLRDAEIYYVNVVMLEMPQVVQLIELKSL